MRPWPLAFIFMVAWSTFAQATETPLLKRGETIFYASGGCGCHTDYENEGSLLAGGRAIQTPFGVFYGTNITPDPQTGIGKWTDADFLRAMTEGTGPDGTHYAPVFPYTSFTQITQEDLLALKAYLFSLPPVRQENKDHDLFIPFGERLGFALWKTLFFTKKDFQPDPSKSEEWNRGAYLVQAVAHCEECHTPRDLRGVLDQSMRFAGSKDGPEGELAPNITPDDETGVGEWSEGDMIGLLKDGFTPEGNDVQGLMGEVIASGYTHLNDHDLKAMAIYLQSIPPIVNKIFSEYDSEEDEAEEDEYDY